MSVNKSGIIDIVSEKAKIPRKRAEDLVDLIFDSMANALANGDRIEIRGFGSFVCREYTSYTGRNPRTGESIEVSPKKLPFFKVGKELRERVDRGAAAAASSGSSSSDMMSGEDSGIN